MLPNSITSRQMFFIVFLTLTAYTTVDLPQTMAQLAGRSSWIPILFNALIFGIMAMIITKLNNMNQGQVFFDYSKKTVGVFLGYVFSIFYLLYFFAVGSYLKWKLLGLVKSNFLPETSQLSIIVVCTIVFCYIAYKGITNIARLFELYGVAFLIVTLVVCVCMLFQGMSTNIRPFFSRTDVSGYLKSVKALAVPFGGLEVLFVIPFTAKNNKKASKKIFFSLLFIGLMYILIVESTICMLGINNTQSMHDAYIEGIKLVKVPFLDRMDIFYLTFGLASLFSGMIMLFTAATEFACKLFTKVNRKIIVILVGLVFATLSYVITSSPDIEDLYDFYFSYLVLVSSIIIPLIVFITAKIRKKVQSSQQSSQQS